MIERNVTTPAWGAWPAGDGQVRFALWALDAHTVEVIFDSGERAALQRQDDGFFSGVVACALDARYRYRVDGQTPVPDPASRWQPDGVHGSSAVQRVDGYHWTHTQWHGRPWDEAVIYELHVGACGGYAGVQAQLPQLAAMGITAIELMPLSAFPGAHNWGYDGVLPYAPAEAYGTPDELKALIDAAHGHGLMVLLDVVYNHFGPDGNYLGSYASAFFNEDKPTPWGAAIDFRKPPVQRYFLDNALMWLHEYGFDGLRLDAVHAITPNAFLDTLRETIEASLPAGRHVHLVLENEANQASQLDRGYTAQWDDDFHNALHVLLTGEEEGYYAAFADQPTQHLARVLGEGFAYQGQPDPRGHVRGEPSGALPPHKFVIFAQNHDQIGNRACGERLSVLVSPQRLRAALALTALTPMIPLFFMGEPWGATQPFLFFTDFGPPLDDAVREGRRREFAHFAAFADPAKRETIPDPNSHATFAASRAPIEDAAHGDGAQWAAWFQALLGVRRQWLVPGLAQARALRASVLADGAVTATWELAGGLWHIAFNVGAEAVPLPPLRGRVGHAENVTADAQTLPIDSFIAWYEEHA
ncbi:malto-oligosyltrehalose trehalohydrolase [Xanthomonas campestris pv. campestris]|uniref:Malto-oligosyltrehalose trehalohydrolase n=1 Tax=Xanthomonas campestris pv. campestris (strain B100) TaxID=509169 RepID=B0RMT8_XANCB|nr:malto-oligosyltrehalose trehalohydrolase [Xanthomonas campestris]MDO0844210.1 malto-oligosyltrehalose trehalohydrolase [Xanthomonas campestris pv. campestris]MEA0622621.1 malto-oligosyltrehalose trehalohydrolase [Xanthomonas campestris pv. campestris]MEA0626879.1 malto-oligosyltrehalose trehalohydrolase [Xanthomonas campestris pv. campestris]MEA0647363.1 malto-oligosyltrehalose trehalohydrolase [Xanthomonas campestris pv. campestris]MEA0667764.1 malto-oligosyltrehalose trehalohydrolase [Xan